MIELSQLSKEVYLPKDNAFFIGVTKNHHLLKINDGSKQVVTSTKLVDNITLSNVMD